MPSDNCSPSDYAFCSWQFNDIDDDGSIVEESIDNNVFGNFSLREMLATAPDDFKKDLSSENGLPNRPYSPEIPTLHQVLDNKASPPYSLASFTAFLAQQLCLETLEFLTDVRRYAHNYYAARKTTTPPDHDPLSSATSFDSTLSDVDLKKLWTRIVDVYIRVGAPREVNLAPKVRDQILGILEPSDIKPIESSDSTLRPLDSPSTADIYPGLDQKKIPINISSISINDSCSESSAGSEKIPSRDYTQFYNDSSIEPPDPSIFKDATSAVYNMMNESVFVPFVSQAKRLSAPWAASSDSRRDKINDTESQTGSFDSSPNQTLSDSSAASSASDGVPSSWKKLSMSPRSWLRPSMSYRSMTNGTESSSSSSSSNASTKNSQNIACISSKPLLLNVCETSPVAINYKNGYNGARSSSGSSFGHNDGSLEYNMLDGPTSLNPIDSDNRLSRLSRIRSASSNQDTYRGTEGHQPSSSMVGSFSDKQAIKKMSKRLIFGRSNPVN